MVFSERHTSIPPRVPHIWYGECWERVEEINFAGWANRDVLDKVLKGGRGPSRDTHSNSSGLHLVCRLFRPKYKDEWNLCLCVKPAQCPRVQRDGQDIPSSQPSHAQFTWSLGLLKSRCAHINARAMIEIAKWGGDSSCWARILTLGKFNFVIAPRRTVCMQRTYTYGPETLHHFLNIHILDWF